MAMHNHPDNEHEINHLFSVLARMMEIATLVCHTKKRLTFGTLVTNSTFDEQENAKNAENEAEAAPILAEWECDK